MFGNVLSWRISVIFFVLTMGAGVWLRTQMQITPPTAISLDPKNLAELAPPVMELPRNQEDDPAEKYSAASAKYEDDPQPVDDYSAKPEGPPPQAMQLVLDAAGMGAMNLFLKNPGDVIDYQTDHPSLDDLSRIGQEMQAAALRMDRAGRKDDARKFLLATYALGSKLMEERVDYDEYSHGLGLMDGALTGLAEVEAANSTAARDDADQESALVAFDQQNVEPIYEMLSSADPVKIAANAGDVFRFAMKSRERLFRVEAILKLGRYRFNAARSADQLAAGRFLRVLAGDSDPAVRAAATAAVGLTVEQYRMIH